MLIPRIFHFIWIGGKPLPEEYKYYIQTWQTLHPDWETILWTDNNLPVHKFTNQELYHTRDGIVFHANIARIELLNLYGGVYVDCDFEAYKNIEPLIKDYDHFFTGETNGIVGNAILGSIPGHPLLRKVIKNMPNNAYRNRDYGPNITVGVVYLTKLLPIEDINYLPPKLFFPTPPGTHTPPGKANEYPESYAHHHWGASWVGVEEKKGYKEWVDENPEDYNWLQEKTGKR